MSKGNILIDKVIDELVEASEDITLTHGEDDEESNEEFEGDYLVEHAFLNEIAAKIKGLI